MPNQKYITAYTDGSCNPIQRIGGWAAILFINHQKIILEGKTFNTTHQRMELMAVLKAVEYIERGNLPAFSLNIFADSQYVVNIQKRKKALHANDFKTKKGRPIRNDDLVRKLVQYMDSLEIKFTKVAAHQKITASANFNREADTLARSIVRNESTNESESYSVLHRN